MTDKTQVSEKMQQLLDLAAEIDDLGHIQALMGWDQQVYMPPNGAEERGLQSAALGKIVHEKFTSDEVGQLIADLEDEVGDLNAETDEARSVKVAKRAYEKQTKVPLPMLMERINRFLTFSMVLSHLSRSLNRCIVLSLHRQKRCVHQRNMP